MPVTRTCTFCGNDIEPGTGKMFIRREGTIHFFCSSKCQKNLLNLGRIGRRVRWTRRYVKALQVGTARRVEVSTPEREEAEEAPAEDRASVLSAFSQIPGVSETTAQGLWEAGFTSVDKLKEGDEAALMEVKGIGPATAKKIRGHLAEAEK